MRPKIPASTAWTRSKRFLLKRLTRRLLPHVLLSQFTAQGRMAGKSAIVHHLSKVVLEPVRLIVVLLPEVALSRLHRHQCIRIIARVRAVVKFATSRAPSKVSHGLTRFVQFRHTGVFQQLLYLLVRRLFRCKEAGSLNLSMRDRRDTWPANHVLTQARVRPRGQEAMLRSHVAVVHIPPLRVPVAEVQAATIRDTPSVRTSGLVMTFGSRNIHPLC